MPSPVLEAGFISLQTSRRRAARKPYAGTGTGAVSGAALGLLAGPAAPIAVPIMATFGAIVGGAGQAILQADAAQEEDKRGATLHHQQVSTETIVAQAGYTTPRGRQENPRKGRRCLREKRNRASKSFSSQCLSF
jgi:hypothetical protein